MRRRAALAVAAVIVLLGGLVVVGCAERSRHARDEVRAMTRTLALIGKLDSPSLAAYRYLSPQFECLIYRRGGYRFALEVCFDGAGRVFETIDRRGSMPVVASLREDPTRSTLKIDRAEADRLLLKMGVPQRLLAPGFST